MNVPAPVFVRTPPSADGLLRFNLAMQRSRAAVMLISLLINLAMRATGELTCSYTLILVSNGAFLLTSLLFYQLYARGLDRRWGINLAPAWLFTDVLFVAWSVYNSGDLGGLFLIWHLVNTAAAAFVAGARATVWVAVANSVAYLGILLYAGEITGWASLLSALLRLALVYGAGFVFLRGIADLREKRLLIRDLMAENRREVSELKELHEALAERTRALGEANDRIREADRLKSQFLANMSHELRTPLNSIIGFSEILVEKLQGQTEPRFHKFLLNILSSGRHLLGLINDILDLSKIEAGKMELVLDRVSLGAVVAGVEGIMHGIADPRAIRLVADVPPDLPPVTVDGPKLKQLLYNLLSNAIKFSPDGAEVRIAVRLLDPEASPLRTPTVEITVSDQGSGIPPEEHERIFDAFHQTDGGASRAHGGTGLGLTIVRSFVELHGGTITVDSAPGRGSTFRVRLPTQARLPEGVPAAADTSGPLVLVVEDDDSFYGALAQDLGAEGYRPLRARNGDDALRLAREARPSLITLDLVLPGLDGWEVLKQLKNDAELREVPVVIVSMVENHELGLALGADDYFLKPLRRGEFLRRIRELVPAAATVLVIDDDPQVHDLVGMELQEAGYRVLGAESGPLGIQLAIEARPAVIVLDLMMPGMSGVEVADALRHEPRTADIPIVILTAKELSSPERLALGGNIAALLSKAPTDRRTLCAIVRDVLQRKKERESGPVRVGG